MTGMTAICQYVNAELEKRALSAGRPNPSTADEFRDLGRYFLEIAKSLREKRPQLQALVDSADASTRGSEALALGGVDAMISVAEQYGERLSIVTVVDDAARALPGEVASAMQGPSYTMCYGEYGDELADFLKDETQLMTTLHQSPNVGCDEAEMVSNWVGHVAVNRITCHTASSTFRVDVFASSDAADAGLRAGCRERRDRGETGLGEAVRGENWVAYSDGNPDATSEELAAVLGGAVIDALADSVCLGEVAWDQGTAAVNAAFCPLWEDFPEMPPLAGGVPAANAVADAWARGWATHAYDAKDVLDGITGSTGDDEASGDARRLSADLGTASHLASEYAWAVKTVAEQRGSIDEARTAAADWRRKFDLEVATLQIRCGG